MNSRPDFEGKRPFEEEYIPLADSPSEVKPWDEIVLNQANSLARGLLINIRNRGYSGLVTDTFLREFAKGGTFDILRRFRDINWQLFDSLEQEHIPPSFREQKSRYYLNLAYEIKKRDKWKIMADMFNSAYRVSEYGLSSSAEVRSDMDAQLWMANNYLDLMKIDITTLYLLTRDRNKLLVGIKDGFVFKDVDIPGERRSNWWEVPVFYASRNYLPFLSDIGRREAIAVLTRLIHPHAIPSLDIKQPVKTSEELIEEAYFKPRYIVPVEGAEVKFRHAGDLIGATMIQSGDFLRTKFVTTQGELLTTFNLQTCGSWGSDSYNENDPRLLNYVHIPEDRFTQAELFNIPVNTYGIPTRLARIVAEVYHDLVTAVEIEGGVPRTLSAPRAQTLERSEEEQAPQVTYIPRIIRKGQKPEVRLPFEGPARPVRPHKVKAHRRDRGNGITPRHEIEVKQFEEKYDLRILENLPAGSTFVLPFFVPREAGDRFSELPQFIKTRIQTQIEEDLRRK